MSKRGRSGQVGIKLRVSCGMTVAGVLNCCDNTGAKSLYIISVMGIRGRLNRMPKAGLGDMCLVSVKKGKPELRKKVVNAIVVR